MVMRQHGICALCPEPFNRFVDLLMTEFEHQRPKGMGCAFTDDRILMEDGVTWRNAAAHAKCNSVKGSRHYEARRAVLACAQGGSMRPRKTIVCVDSNEQALSVLRFVLDTAGFRVIGFTDPHAALRFITTAAPEEIDLLLSQIALKGMDGNDLVYQAKRASGVKTLLTSRTITNPDRAAAADAFLPKGANSPAELIDRIRVLIARRRGPKKVAKVFAEMRAA